ncbi:APC family permease [Actinoalloteichus hymeniacidonis]|uniref:Amino acid permease n=1 Tax=Actinoalloteichus hymeniacidonis TaxID=340345 RepID=A0AAC9HT15_9PSEU|nr:hypothetical protein [Actinoalloteichus hymeniacidonis]AOS65157.1 hypothetical protein TL08_21850 [Actinoalloteichus hymeniacidonis]MBB5906764.1 APA family basic amino acid/polyamine antiporter [Actinoalloteichus hymeniacidonis]
MTRLLTSDRRTSPLSLIGSALAALVGSLGVGVFLVPALGVATAGRWLPLAVLIALVAAICTVSSSVVVAAARNRSGNSHRGGYVDLRDQLGRQPARVSWLAFVTGQVVLACGVAGVLVDYLWPGQRSWAGPLVILVAVTVLIGRLPRPRGTRLLPLSVLAVSVIVVIAAFALEPPAPTGAAAAPPVDLTGFAEAAAVAFLAFCGFERFTTDPTRHRASAGRPGVLAPMVIALSVSAALLLVIAMAGVYQLGVQRFGLSPIPLADLLVVADAGPLSTLVGIAALAGLLPAVLGALASARDAVRVAVDEGELRNPFRAARTGTAAPSRAAELLVGIPAGLVVLTMEPAAALALGCCLLLAHYAFLNVAARLLAETGASERLGCAGMFATVILAMSLPVSALLGTVVVLGVGSCLLALIARRDR